MKNLLYLFPWLGSTNGADTAPTKGAAPVPQGRMLKLGRQAQPYRRGVGGSLCGCNGVSEAKLKVFSPLQPARHAVKYFVPAILQRSGVPRSFLKGRGKSRQRGKKEEISWVGYGGVGCGWRWRQGEALGYRVARGLVVIQIKSGKAASAVARPH